MDKSQLLQEILDIHDNWTAIVGFIDIVKVNSLYGTHFVTKYEYNSDITNKLANKLTLDDFWTIIGKGEPDMILDSLREYEFKVDREGYYEIKALLKWIGGEYDEYGRCTMRDYLEIDHIELNFIRSFESRNRDNKLNEILSNDLENLFN